MPSRLKALFLLALALIRSLLKRLLGVGRTGTAAFHANYASDGLPAVTPEERKLLPNLGGCIACGICDRGEAERIARSGGEYHGLMGSVLGASRSMPDYGAAYRSLRWVPDEVLREKRQQCPVDFPFETLARFVEDKAGAARISVEPKPLVSV